MHDVGQLGILEDDAGEDSPWSTEEYLACQVDAGSCPDLRAKGDKFFSHFDDYTVCGHRGGQVVDN